MCFLLLAKSTAHIKNHKCRYCEFYQTHLDCNGQPSNVVSAKSLSKYCTHPKSKLHHNFCRNHLDSNGQPPDVVCKPTVNLCVQEHRQVVCVGSVRVSPCWTAVAHPPKAIMKRGYSVLIRSCTHSCMQAQLPSLTSCMPMFSEGSCETRLCKLHTHAPHPPHTCTCPPNHTHSCPCSPHACLCFLKAVATLGC